ncbi:hypothetical protein IGI92_000540 [Enterococcus sp. DIV2379]|jgi:hypothetical protein
MNIKKTTEMFDLSIHTTLLFISLNMLGIEGQDCLI